MDTGYNKTKFYSNLAGESVDIGQTATDALFANSRVLRRDCPACSSSGSKTIYYKRISAIPNGWSMYSNALNVWTSTNNILGTDFYMYSSYIDFLQDTNRFGYCNYNDFSNNIGAFRDWYPFDY